MSKPTVDSRIWEILAKYEDYLSFDERAEIACKLDDLFNEAKKSTPDFDRLMALESEVLRHSKALEAQAETLDLHTLKIAGQYERLVKIEEHPTNNGKIAELTEQVRTLHAQLAAVADEHSELKKCIEEFCTNIYMKIL